jgi:cell division protein FtsI/penicillin-binding protein 2
MKVVTTVAGLEEGIVKLDEQFPVVTEINPSPETGANVIENAHDEPCGGDFTTAFAKSCNTVFAPLGVDVGGEKLVETAERFGFNTEPTLYDREATEATDPQPMEMPTEFDETGTELAASAIGQHTVLATTLGMASVAQTIANEGTRMPTPIARSAELQPDAEPVEVTSPETAATMRQMMIEVVNNGTGTAAAVPGVQVAGKTGTAEVSVGGGIMNHAWFICFAPSDRPEVAVAVVSEFGGVGGQVAAPLARQILQAVLPLVPDRR